MTAGELRFRRAKSDNYVYADSNGHRHADLSVQLDVAVTLHKTDFPL